MQIDFKLLKLLSSRICHDVISPVNSAKFAFDIFNDEYEKNATSDNNEAIDTMAISFKALIAKLEYFRSAFGLSGLPEGAVGIVKIKELIVNLLEEKEVRLNWNEEIDEALLSFAKNESYKLILNIFLIIFYAIQKTAEITIYSKEIGKNQLGLAIEVKGAGIKLSIDNIQAIRLEISELDLTPRNIQSYFTALISKDNNSRLEVKDNMQGVLQFAFVLNR
jgi:histidine phosphotransferase ChpT